MKLYMSLQSKHGEAVKTNNGDTSGPECKNLEKEMAMVLGRIEAAKDAWVQLKGESKQVKEELLSVEEEITDERAELVATAGLLDQNDKLREQIQEEERAKAKALIEQEISDAKAALQLEYGDASHESLERISILENQLSEARLASSDSAESRRLDQASRGEQELCDGSRRAAHRG